jgi:hypothetical protein
MSTNRNLFAEAIATATGGERLDTPGAPQVELPWTKGAVLWLLSPTVVHTEATQHEGFREFYRHARPINDIEVDFHSMTTIEVRDTANLPGEYLNINERRRFARGNSDADLVAFGSLSEGFWQTLGYLEIAKQGYVVISEFVAPSVTTGMPDGVAYQLGEVQERLASHGYLSGGATLPELALRSCFDEREPLTADSAHRVTVLEAKKCGKGADGHRELSSHRSRSKPPYMSSDAVDGGWLICPKDAGRLDRLEDIGAVTWSQQSCPLIASPPSQSVDTETRQRKLQQAKRLVLDQVLRYQPLEEPLSDVINECIENPSALDLYIETS